MLVSTRKLTANVVHHSMSCVPGSSLICSYSLFSIPLVAVDANPVHVRQFEGHDLRYRDAGVPNTPCRQRAQPGSSAGRQPRRRVLQVRAWSPPSDFSGVYLRVHGGWGNGPLMQRGLSPRRVRFAWREWQRQAGFDRLYPFHALRHTSVTAVYRATRDLFLAQRFARHARP